jgi:hypothetical protein
MSTNQRDPRLAALQEETSWRGITVVPDDERDEFEVWFKDDGVLARFPRAEDAWAYIDAMVRLEHLDAPA